MTDPDLVAAWDEVHAATPTGWQVGRPYLHDERAECSTHGCLVVARASKPKKDWIAVGDTEVECLREMARCLGELGEGRWPK